MGGAVALGSVCENFVLWVWDLCALGMGPLCFGYGTFVLWVWDLCALGMGPLCFGYGTFVLWVWDLCALVY